MTEWVKLETVRGQVAKLIDGAYADELEELLPADWRQRFGSELQLGAEQAVHFEVGLEFKGARVVAVDYVADRVVLEQCQADGNRKERQHD